MSNSDPQPWRPDPSTGPGVAPVAGAGGEHGTSSFAGNSEYNADCSHTNPAAPGRGPAIGADSTGGAAAAIALTPPSGTHDGVAVTAYVRSSAGT